MPPDPATRPVRPPGRDRPRPVLGGAAPRLRPGRARLPRRAAGPAACCASSWLCCTSGCPACGWASRCEELEHTVVSEGRGMVALPAGLDAGTGHRALADSARGRVPREAAADPGRRSPAARPARRRRRTDAYHRRARRSVPAWEPGAHIDLELPDGRCGSTRCAAGPEDAELRIAVLREARRRGGSLAVHDQPCGWATGCASAARATTSGCAAGVPASFVAGGIGITPLLPMIEEAEHRGIPIGACSTSARSRERMAYVDDLAARYRVPRRACGPAGERGRYDLGGDLAPASRPARRTSTPAAPRALLAGLEDAAARWRGPRGAARRRAVRRPARRRTSRTARSRSCSPAAAGRDRGRG